MKQTDQQQRYESHYLSKMLLSLDLFGEPAPTFNIRGETRIRTYFGAVLSTMIITVTLLFSLFKLQHLLSRHNPTVN